MNSYYCNSCGRYFNQGPSGSYTCPSCGSNNILERNDPSVGTFWTSKGFFISLSAIVLMLVILFILPEYLRKYEVRIDRIPQLCKYRIVVTKRGTPVDSTNFIYSIDGGKHYQHLNEFKIDTITTGTVMVKPDSGLTRVKEIKNTFSNPFLFKPLCKKEDPCDCKEIKIIRVSQEPVFSTRDLVIHTNHPKCKIEYSINGKNGPYQTDSVFPDKQAGNYNIFIKTVKCTIEYSKNPWTILPPKKEPVKISAPAPINFVPESEVSDKPYPTQLGSDREQLKSYLKEKLSDFSISAGITITFIVESSGDCSHFTVAPATNNDLNIKVSRVIHDLGGWTQGFKNGNSVNTKVTIRLP